MGAVESFQVFVAGGVERPGKLVGGQMEDFLADGDGLFHFGEADNAFVQCRDMGHQQAMVFAGIAPRHCAGCVPPQAIGLKPFTAK